VYSYEQLLKTVEPIVRNAGDILLSYFGNDDLKREEKEGKGSVTEADMHSERYLIAELTKAFPETSFIAEESGESGQGEYCWVIDPLDGTTNFERGLPYFCISVALTYKGAPLFGIVYQPLLNELFHAYKGKGAFCNGKRLQVTSKQALEGSVLVIGLPYAKTERYQQLVRSLQDLAVQVYAFRFFGAAALDLAYVACAGLEGVLFVDLGWWDVAAGMLLVQESGGLVTDFEGSEVTSSFTSLIAAGKPVHEKLKKVLKVEFRN